MLSTRFTNPEEAEGPAALGVGSKVTHPDDGKYTNQEMAVGKQADNTQFNSLSFAFNDPFDVLLECSWRVDWLSTLVLSWCRLGCPLRERSDVGKDIPGLFLGDHSWPSHLRHGCSR